MCQVWHTALKKQKAPQPSKNRDAFLIPSGSELRQNAVIPDAG